MKKEAEPSRGDGRQGDLPDKHPITYGGISTSENKVTPPDAGVKQFSITDTQIGTKQGSIILGMAEKNNECERDLFAFLPLAKIKVATSVCAGSSNMPLAYCDLDYSNPLTKPKRRPPIGWSSFWRSERDLNLAG